MNVASAKWNAASLGPTILQQNTITLLDSQNNTRYFGLKHGRTINISKCTRCILVYAIQFMHLSSHKLLDAKTL